MLSYILKYLIGMPFFEWIMKSFNANAPEVSSKRSTTFFISMLTGMVVFVGARRIYLSEKDISDNYLIFVGMMLIATLTGAGIILLENININKAIDTFKMKQNESVKPD